MKLVVVGGVAGGASTAARVRRIDASAEITIFEKGPDVSYSNCSLPYYLGGYIEDSGRLIMNDPATFKSQHDINVRTLCEVTEIDRAAKEVVVRDLRSGETFREPYDKLVLAPGAAPILPKSIKGIDGDNVFSLRNVQDVTAIKDYLDQTGKNRVIVVGGGFIGIEVAENLVHAGKKVTVVEGMDQVMAPFDHDMVQMIHKELVDNGVDLHLSSTVTEITPDGAVAEKKDGTSEKIPADAVIMAIGVSPETGLARKAGLEIGETRGIKVDHNYRTSDPDIYAVGDAVETFNALTHKPGRLALAGPAQRAARAAADHMYGIPHNNKGYIGSSCAKIFSLNTASTGLNEKAAEAAGYSFDSVLLFPTDKVGIMPDSHYMAFKLVFEVPTGKILGAQAIGKGAADKRADVIATLIRMNGTLEDLKEMELCYSPVYGTAKDVVNMAALVALNILYGKFEQVHVSEVRGLVESGAYIIDVREKNEYEQGHIKGAHNIPLSCLRDRLDEIPKDVPVYVHCRSGQRSYYACCALLGRGFTNVKNISGSYLGISLYEYYTDQAEGREPILTAYNFN